MTRAEIKALKQARKALNPPKGLRPLSMAANFNEPPKGLPFSGAPNHEAQVVSVSEKEISFETVLVKQEVDSDSEISVPLFDLEDLKSRV